MEGNLEGTVLGERHRLIRRLKAGAVADVYLAQDEIMDRTVAVKLLKKELHANPDLVTRFRQEAQVGALCGHPNINYIFDFSQTSEGQNYLLMNMIEGKTLYETVTAVGALNSKQFKNVFIQVCEALELMHRTGIIHLNLQPKHIMIHEATGFAVLVDFYSAKLNLQRKETMYQLPDYMTISDYINFEQCAEQPVSNQSDIYSLGCVMYFALTGRPPFLASSRQELRNMHLNAPVSADLLPAEFAPIVVKAMAKNPADRFKSVEEILTALGR